MISYGGGKEYIKQTRKNNNENKTDMNLLLDIVNSKGQDDISNQSHSQNFENNFKNQTEIPKNASSSTKKFDFIKKKGNSETREENNQTTPNMTNKNEITNFNSENKPKINLFESLGGSRHNTNNLNIDSNKIEENVSQPITNTNVSNQTKFSFIKSKKSDSVQGIY